MSALQLSPNLGESPEHIAFRLFELILSEEVSKPKKPAVALTEQWILETYARCLTVVKKPEGSINWTKIAAAAGVGR
jgi:hypothetical protein